MDFLGLSVKRNMLCNIIVLFTPNYVTITERHCMTKFHPKVWSGSPMEAWSWGHGGCSLLSGISKESLPMHQAIVKTLAQCSMCRQTTMNYGPELFGDQATWSDLIDTVNILVLEMYQSSSTFVTIRNTQAITKRYYDRRFSLKFRNPVKIGYSLA